MWQQEMQSLRAGDGSEDDPYDGLHQHSRHSSCAANGLAGLVTTPLKNVPKSFTKARKGQKGTRVLAAVRLSQLLRTTDLIMPPPAPSPLQRQMHDASLETW